MTFSESETGVARVSGFDGAMGAPPPFGPAEQALIDRHWSAAIAERPAMFDGRVLLARDVSVSGDRLTARYAEVAFSAFHWWRAEGAGGPLRNVFGAAAVVAADGGVLLGRMAPHTAAAGMIYFPCGTPDLSDLDGDRVDLEGSIRRELEEETGVTAEEATPSADAFAVFAPKVAAFVRRYDSPLPSEELKRRIDARLAAETQAELDQVRFVRALDELTAASPPYVRLVLPHILRRT